MSERTYQHSKSVCYAVIAMAIVAECSMIARLAREAMTF